MTDSKGWIKLHRKINDWEWYTDVPVKVLFIHLLINANHEAGRWRGTSVERGELITSLSHLAEQTGLSIKQVRTAIKKLEKSGEISVKGAQRFTLVKCCNYDVYQAFDSYEGHETGTKAAHEGHETGTQRATNNNNKNNKNNKNKNILRKPSFNIEEIARRAKLNDDYDI